MKRILICLFLAATLFLAYCGKPAPKPEFWVTNVQYTTFTNGMECYQRLDTDERFWFVKNTMPPRINYYIGGDRTGYIWDRIDITSLNMMTVKSSYQIKVVLNGDTGMAYLNADGQFTAPSALIKDFKDEQK